MRSAGREILRFEGYTLDLTRGCVRGESGEMELRPKSFDLLRYLVENAGRLISKDELVDAVWPNVIVGDDSLAQCVSELRHALNDPERRIIKTIPRRGYLFAAPVSVQPGYAAAGQTFAGVSDGADQEHTADGALALGPASSNQQDELNTTRRLAAILAADVVGYWRLIDADLVGTLGALEAIRADLLDPTIAAHKGRLLEKRDDLLLAEFSNVVDALCCATQLQEAMSKHNVDLPAEKRIQFRIGIHQGDVVIQDDHLFGDGVIIATGLEGLAASGGICLSARAKEDAEGKLAVQFEDIGEQRFKNGSRQVHAYRIPPSGASSERIPETTTRRLAAILAADVVGYSRLIGADEDGTLRALKAIRAELFDPTIAAHNGRLVKTTGDGLLVEYSSVVDALRCATQLQKRMAEHNESLPADKRIDFRIGIHQGDVVVEDGDLFGDGVNVAFRLEGLADPGGICVSARVQEDAAGKLDLTFENMGEQELKNIARPMYSFRVVPSGSQRMRAQLSVASPARLSIAVLPFVNLSNDPEHEYFVDGITDDLATDLSRIWRSFVIARNTAFTYKGKPVDVKKIGRELGVRYVLEGSARRSGNRVRINAQLIDAETAAHLWADRGDYNIGDLFAVQDEITMRIAVALNLELMTAEAARTVIHPDTFDYILRARATLQKPPSNDNYVEAISLLDRALVLDRCSVDAQALCASALASRVLDEMSGSATADIVRAERLVAQALAASPHGALPHFASGEVLRAQGRPEEAIPEFEMAIALNRNWVDAIAGLGWCKFFAGSLPEVIPLHEQAIRLSPRDPEIGPWYFRIGRAHLVQSRIDEAIHWLEKGVRANADHPLLHAHLASAYALTGEAARAATELAKARKFSRDARYTSIARLAAAGYFGVPRVRALFESTYFAGLRKAGMPEE
jgi:class 3 adenylate cyclase